jgi:hypothetical protein
MTANEQVLPVVWELKNIRLASEVSLFIQRLENYSNVQKSSFCRHSANTSVMGQAVELKKFQ